jgi:thiol:disulfide interchange protein DsbD
MRAAVFAVVLVLAASAAQAQPPRAKVTPITESGSVAGGGETRLAVTVSLPPKLHVQSDKPRDPSLIPTVLTVEAPAGVQVANLIYPHPEDFLLEGEKVPLLVFDNEFVVGATIRIDASVAAGTLTIPGRFRYQACDDKMCFQPRTERFEWTLTVAPAGTNVARNEDAIFKELGTGRITDPPAPEVIPLPGAPAATAAAPVDDNAAIARLANFEVQGTTGGYLGSTDFVQFIRDAEQGVGNRGWFEGRGPLAILLLILVGGLALNLTPCVLPMIPINLAIIGAGAQAGSRRRGFLLGSTYGAAMAVVYGVLGLVVVLTAGTFGTINSSPWFNLAIAILSRCSTSSTSTSPSTPAACRILLNAAPLGWPSSWAPSPHFWRALVSLPSSFKWCCFPAASTHQGRHWRLRCRSCSVSAWRYPGRSRAPDSRRCRNPEHGWCA